MGTSSERWVTVKPHKHTHQTLNNWACLWYTNNLQGNSRGNVVFLHWAIAAVYSPDKCVWLREWCMTKHSTFNNLLSNSIFSLLLSPAFPFLAIIKAFCPFTLKSGLLPFYSLIARTSRTTSSNLFLKDKEAFSFSKFNYFYSDWEWFIVEASWWDTQSFFGVFLRNTQCPASSQINNKKKNTNQASLVRHLQLSLEWPKKDRKKQDSVGTMWNLN